MKVQEFLDTMAAMSADEKKAIVMCVADLEAGSHVDWLERWHLYRDHACKLSDNCPIAKELFEKANQLTIQIATTPATTLKDAVAQVEWFKEDLGEYVLGNATPAHDKIFDTLLESVEHIST